MRSHQQYWSQISVAWGMQICTCIFVYALKTRIVLHWLVPAPKNKLKQFDLEARTDPLNLRIDKSNKISQSRPVENTESENDVRSKYNEHVALGCVQSQWIFQMQRIRKRLTMNAALGYWNIHSSSRWSAESVGLNRPLDERSCSVYG